MKVSNPFASAGILRPVLNIPDPVPDDSISLAVPRGAMTIGSVAVTRDDRYSVMDNFETLMVALGVCRVVKNSRRARKLRKRGEPLRWNNRLRGWVWSESPRAELWNK